ncbi:MAG TPA: tetratricopeptide repeat protein, partial [Cyclobacteriaceae bacterium]|nr:tetratricopeptide repeat protein [Cyclobacteriaceae bacterium]
EAFENGMGTDSLPKNKIEKEPTNDPLIEQIKTTKKKLKVENPKQKEQNEIIDKFIKIQPSIPKAKPAESASDLSEDSGMFSDNIVSETLVEILLKQGKKDKAVEVLKKLIWKFPQKKAYFAAQIDSLKN